MPEHVPKELEELPPTAKLAYKILEYERKLTRQELRKETLLAQRTVYGALCDLEEIDAIDSRPCQTGLRQTVYYISGRK